MEHVCARTESNIHIITTPARRHKACEQVGPVDATQGPNKQNNAENVSNR